MKTAARFDSEEAKKFLRSRGIKLVISYVLGKQANHADLPFSGDCRPYGVLAGHQCDFINYDDPSYVTENIHIRNGVTTEAIRGHSRPVMPANWHPVTWMSQCSMFNSLGETAMASSD